MGNYENGVNTRKDILQICNRLFYENGFHETNHNDICSMGYWNRGTVYYHFKSKERMRYASQWEYIANNKCIAEKYCPEERYQYMIAMGIYW